ncbi:MAG: cell division protein FtsX [Patescibacteria group bacterium]
MIKVRRLIKYTYEHIRRNGWLSFSSVAIMTLTFFVISIFIFTLYSVNVILHYYESKSQVIVFFNPQASSTYISGVKTKIQDTGKATSIKFISKEVAYKRFVKLLKTQNPALAKSVDMNALPPSFEVSTQNLSNLQDIANTLYKLKKNSNGQIDNILYFKNVVQFLKQAVSVISDVGLGLIIFLGIIAFVIIVITIAITINSHSEDIEIMKLVGASTTYVVGPFIMEGALYGVMGVFMSSVVLYLIFFIISTYYKATILFPLEQFFQGVPLPHYSLFLVLEVVGIEAAIGIVIGVIASSISITKYLK